MKKLCYFATAALLLFHLMTVTIGWPGGSDYSLVVKPYPSFLARIPNMEWLAWNAAIKSGDIPAWVAKGKYLELARGNGELQPKPWERAYAFSLLVTAAGLIATGLLVVNRFFRTLVSRHTVKEPNVA
jgi:hypothetical protein